MSDDSSPLGFFLIVSASFALLVVLTTRYSTANIAKRKASDKAKRDEDALRAFTRKSRDLLESDPVGGAKIVQQAFRDLPYAVVSRVLVHDAAIFLRAYSGAVREGIDLLCHIYGDEYPPERLATQSALCVEAKDLTELNLLFMPLIRSPRDPHRTRRHVYLYMYARGLQNLGSATEALQHFKKVAQLSPGYRDTTSRIAQLTREA
jgi:hypothetical protein